MGHRVNSKHPLPANPKGSSKEKGSSKDKGNRRDNSRGRELQPLEALKVVREQTPIQVKVREPKRAHRAQRKAVGKVDKVQPGS
jgi:hypothetical protein